MSSDRLSNRENTNIAARTLAIVVVVGVVVLGGRGFAKAQHDPLGFVCKTGNEMHLGQST